MRKVTPKSSSKFYRFTRGWQAGNLKIAFGTKGYPFKSPFYQKELDYSPGLCPISEKMWFEDLFYFKIQNFLPKLSDIDKFDFAINKILNNVDEIQTYFNEKD